MVAISGDATLSVDAKQAALIQLKEAIEKGWVARQRRQALK
jgi:hypothetical protein